MAFPIQYSTCIRQKPYEIKSEEILVGDILKIHTGDIIQADGILVQEIKELLIDESTIRQSNKFVKKSCISPYSIQQENPFLFAGSKIIEGNGLMLVLQVGENTYYSKNQEQNKNLQQHKSLKITPSQRIIEE